MSLHDELAGEVGTACKLCIFLASLDPADAAEWRAELVKPIPVIGHFAVVNALRRRGIRVTETSVRRHRKRHTA